VRPKLSALCIAAATTALCAALATGAQAATVASIRPSFAPDRLGASTALSLAVAYSAEGGGVPEPVRHAIVHLPAGLRIDVRGAGICPRSRLEKQSGRGCPASARVGSGSALAAAHLGAITINENAAVTAWRGPDQGGRPVLEILGEGLTPLEERIVVTGVLEPDHGPFGQRLTMTVPPIPTLPTEPDASIVRFSLSVGAGHGRLGRLIHAPSRCPAGGFPFAADFAYADGSSGSASATARCP
jgi:hypothetical protein